MACM